MKTKAPAKGAGKPMGKNKPAMPAKSATRKQPASAASATTKKRRLTRPELRALKEAAVAGALPPARATRAVSKTKLNPSAIPQAAKTSRARSVKAKA